MTDLPERIWAGTYSGKKDAGYWHNIADVWNGVEYVRADLAVRVKPLEWIFHPANPETGFLPHEQAAGLGGHYLIEYCCGSGGVEYDLWIPSKVSRFLTLDAAKAAAQADYETRIKGALE